MSPGIVIGLLHGKGPYELLFLAYPLNVCSYLLFIHFIDAVTGQPVIVWQVAAHQDARHTVISQVGP